MLRRAALLLALTGPVAARACPDAVPLRVDPGLSATLTRWIAAHSAYLVEDLGPPTILICRPGEAIGYAGREVIVSRNLRAAYDIANDRIFLVAPWSAGNPENVAALLHELIHRLQFHQRSWPCPQAAEPEAYRLQALWLRAQGIAADFDWLRITVEARCPGGPHP